MGVAIGVGILTILSLRAAALGAPQNTAPQPRAEQARTQLAQFLDQLAKAETSQQLLERLHQFADWLTPGSRFVSFLDDSMKPDLLKALTKIAMERPHEEAGAEALRLLNVVLSSNETYSQGGIGTPNYYAFMQSMPWTLLRLASDPKLPELYRSRALRLLPVLRKREWLFDIWTARRYLERIQAAEPQTSVAVTAAEVADLFSDAPREKMGAVAFRQMRPESIKAVEKWKERDLENGLLSFFYGQWFTDPYRLPAEIYAFVSPISKNPKVREDLKRRLLNYKNERSSRNAALIIQQFPPELLLPYVEELFALAVQVGEKSSGPRSLLREITKGFGGRQALGAVLLSKKASISDIELKLLIENLSSYDTRSTEPLDQEAVRQIAEWVLQGRFTIPSRQSSGVTSLLLYNSTPLETVKPALQFLLQKYRALPNARDFDLEIRQIERRLARPQAQMGTFGVANGGILGTPLAAFYGWLERKGVKTFTILFKWAPAAETVIFQIILVGLPVLLGLHLSGTLGALIGGLVGCALSAVLYGSPHTHAEIVRGPDPLPQLSLAKPEDRKVLRKRGLIESLLFFASMGILSGFISYFWGISGNLSWVFILIVSAFPSYLEHQLTQGRDGIYGTANSGAGDILQYLAVIDNYVEGFRSDSHVGAKHEEAQAILRRTLQEYGEPSLRRVFAIWAAGKSIDELKTLAKEDWLAKVGQRLESSIINQPDLSANFAAQFFDRLERRLTTAQRLPDAWFVPSQEAVQYITSFPSWAQNLREKLLRANTEQPLLQEVTKCLGDWPDPMGWENKKHELELRIQEIQEHRRKPVSEELKNLFKRLVRGSFEEDVINILSAHDDLLDAILEDQYLRQSYENLKDAQAAVKARKERNTIAVQNVRIFHNWERVLRQQLGKKQEPVTAYSALWNQLLEDLVNPEVDTLDEFKEFFRYGVPDNPEATSKKRNFVIAKLLLNRKLLAPKWTSRLWLFQELRQIDNAFDELLVDLMKIDFETISPQLAAVRAKTIADFRPDVSKLARETLSHIPGAYGFVAAIFGVDKMMSGKVRYTMNTYLDRMGFYEGMFGEMTPGLSATAASLSLPRGLLASG